MYNVIGTYVDNSSFCVDILDTELAQKLTIIIKSYALGKDEIKSLLLWQYQNLSKDNYDELLKREILKFAPRGNNVQCFYTLPVNDIQKCVDVAVEAMMKELELNPLLTLQLRSIKLEDILKHISGFMLNKSMNLKSDKIMGDEMYNKLPCYSEEDK